VVATLLAQVVLTLRSIFFRSGSSGLIATEWNRIYAVTSKNRVIVSCFGAMTISQFAFGLYAIVYAAVSGCESATMCRLQFPKYLLQCFSTIDLTGPTSDLYDMHLRGTVVRGSRTYHHVSRIWYEIPLVLRPEDIHSDRPTDLLAFSVIVCLVVRSNVNKIPVPSLLRTIVRDATCYFLIIFTSHFVLVMFLVFGRVRILS
jgi:hypothetical protein